MGGCFSSDAGRRRSTTEILSSSRAESSRRSYDITRDQANSSREQSSSGSDSASQYDEISPRHTGESSDSTIEQARAQAIENGRAKLKQYQQEALYYQNKDRDTMQELLDESFRQIVITETRKSVFNVTFSVGNNSRNSRYYNTFDVNIGIITGRSNTRDGGLSFSEIIFHQLRSSLEKAQKDFSHFDLKIWNGKSITNDNTKETIELFVNNNETKTFYKDSDEFTALAGTATAQSKFYLLAQHPNAFRGKEVTSITVERQLNGTLNISYAFE